MNEPYLQQESADQVLLEIYVQPGTKHSEFAGEHDGRLKIRIASPPVNGKANKEVCRFLAKSFALSKSCVTICRGEKSRQKTLLLKNITLAAVRSTLEAHRVQHD